MSVQMMGAVIASGPQDRTQFCVLLAVANYADDFGFAYPSIETIAADSRCDMRTARRQIMDLEANGWLYCARKAVNGKSNAYILNVARMGVTVPPTGRRSPLFIRLFKSLGDTLTPIFSPEKSEDIGAFSAQKSEKSEDIGTFSEDNSQPLTGQNDPTQRTFQGGSEDIACPPNRYNRQEPSGTKSTIEPPTLPSHGEGGKKKPSPGETAGDVDADAEDRWAALKTLLKREMHDVPIGVEKAKRWKGIEQDAHDFTACFAAWWLVRVERNGGGTVFFTEAGDEAATAAGVKKYRKRLAKLAQNVFNLPKSQAVTFEVQGAPEAPADAEALGGADGHEAPAAEVWEQVRRMLRQGVGRLAQADSRGKLARDRHRYDLAIDAARLESVQPADGRPAVWRLSSPVPHDTREVMGLFQGRIDELAGGETEIVVLGAEGESP